MKKKKPIYTEVGEYKYQKLVNLTKELYEYNLFKENIDKESYIINPNTQKYTLELIIYEHNYKYHSWTPKKYEECEYDLDTNQFVFTDCITYN